MSLCSPSSSPPERNKNAKMSRKQKSPISSSSSSRSKVQISSDIVISKIIQHSRNPGSPRLLKYLLEVKKNFSSVNFKLWMDLRTKGGLHAIETVVRSFANVEQFRLCAATSKSDANSDPDVESKSSIEGNPSPCHDQESVINSGSGSTPETTVRRDVFINGLSVLGNAYSLDYTARKEAVTTGFVEVLHVIIQIATGSKLKPGTLKIRPSSASAPAPGQGQPSTSTSPIMGSAECDIAMRAVKCVANLARDSDCREAIFKIGLGISIIKVLDQFNNYFAEKKSLSQPHCQSGNEIEIDESSDSDVKFQTQSNNEMYKECIRASVRAIRILSSEPCTEEGKTHLIRFGAVMTIGKILSWNVTTPDEDFSLDVEDKRNGSLTSLCLQAMISLTDRIRLLPTEQIAELVSEDTDNDALKKIIDVFIITPTHSTIFSSTIRCLTGLAYNTRIAECLARMNLLKAALEKLKHTSGKSSLELCRLLLILTKHSSVNRCRLNNCQEIWSTLQILKCAELQDYHRWVLHVYENVYEGSLKSLLRNGLLELIQDQFKQELEDCDNDILKTKITSLDDNNCRIHSDDCQFKPVYRCDSPSYQQVQEEITTKLQMGTDYKRADIESSSSGIDSSSSPSSSPGRSWTSDDSGSELGVSTSRSRSRSPTSSNSSISDDEGCYSPVDSTLSYSPTYSETSPEKLPNESDPSSSPIRITKRPRLDSTFSEEKFRTDKKSEFMKNKSKKIVAMLNILHKMTFLNPMPPNLIQIVPILLSFLVRGIVSLLPQSENYDDYTRDLESLRLGRQSFSLAYRILRSLSLNINMFPELVRNGTITIISRLFLWDQSLNDLGTGQNMENLMWTMCGKSNDTAGWREGYLLRTLLISKSEDELNRIALAIPLLYRRNDHVLRNFESKGRSWSRVFDLLMKSDEINPSLFQDCILSISTLCSTIGMKYTLIDAASRPMLRKVGKQNLSDSIILGNPSSNPSTTNEQDKEGKVEITLDDGSSVFIRKNLLTEASPVFAAMFDGNFMEAGSQKVQIKDVSLTAISAMVEQLYAHSLQNDNTQVLPIDYNHYELSTLFELLSVADQYLLDKSVYTRTLNTLLCFYICPYAAPSIYAEAVKLSTLWKPESRLKEMDLTFIVLKYLLVGNLNISSKCCAIRKIFDIVPAVTVVGDLRALVEFYSTRPQ